MIDGRVLNSLTKDDLKKHLKITKKVDQMSFLSGVELLRMHDFNREVCLWWEESRMLRREWLGRGELVIMEPPLRLFKSIVRTQETLSIGQTETWPTGCTGLTCR